METKCPVHAQDALRREVGPDGYPTTGFCLKCLKQYPLCRSVLYMSQCWLVAGHEGGHVGRTGGTWTDASLKEAHGTVRPKETTGE